MSRTSLLASGLFCLFVLSSFVVLLVFGFVICLFSVLLFVCWCDLFFVVLLSSVVHMGLLCVQYLRKEALCGKNLSAHFVGHAYERSAFRISISLDWIFMVTKL